MPQPAFDITSRAFKRDPSSELARMRAAGPLVRVKLPLVGQIWMATTYESVTTMLRDQQHFVMEPRHAGRKGYPGILRWLPPSFRVLRKNMLTTDEPGHRRLRGLVEQAFLRQSVENMRARLESLADQYLERMEVAARNAAQSVDLIKHFARPFPLAVICELLGLPEEDRPRFSTFAERLMKAASLRGVLTALPAVRQLLRYFKRQFELCRESPRPGLISALVEAEQDGQRLSEDELLAMTHLLLLAGHETTVHLISTGVYALLRHEDQRAKLISDWSKAPAAVDECLRYMSPIQMSKPRYAASDMERFGRQLKRGDIVIALLAAANSDPAAFPHPETFDIDRHPNHHVSFGTGIHVCLGLKLARAEGAIAFQKLFTRFPRLELAVADAELRWTERIGVRALKSLPLRLRAAVPSSPLA